MEIAFLYYSKFWESLTKQQDRVYGTDLDVSQEVLEKVGKNSPS